MAEERYLARIYRPKHQRQKTKYQGVLIGCTETSLAMLVDAVSFGGCLVDEVTCRVLSGEWPPDPNSPGLNLDQIEKVAKKLHVSFTDKTGETWDDLLGYLSENRRAIVQLWHDAIGGNHIGHAVHVQAVRLYKGSMKALINDPTKNAATWVELVDLRKGMDDFANSTGVPGQGLRFGVSAPTKYMAWGAT